jgi:hypothetical protein
MDDVLSRLVQAIYAAFRYRLVSAALVEADKLVFRARAVSPGTSAPPDVSALPSMDQG